MKQDLTTWQERYERARDGFRGKQDEMKRFQEQYDGTLMPQKGTDTICVYNFTKELVESAIDATVPLPKVEPLVKSERNLKLARTIEALLINEGKRINMEPFNDVDERVTKIMGGSVAVVEWNNMIHTNDSVGDVDLRLISPRRFTPQEGVFDIDKMDYFFVDFEDTKERIKKLYGVDVSREGLDLTIDDITDDDSDENVTQVWAYYRNEKGGVGLFSWVGDTVIIDDDEYQARGEEVCTQCEKTRAVGEETCICGCRTFRKRNLEYEELETDIARSDGLVIPAQSHAKDDFGNYLYEEVSEPVTGYNPVTGMQEQMYEQIFDEQMNVIGEEPMMQMVKQVYYEPTKIPYYVPKRYPIAIRKNVSALNEVFGDSDVGAITTPQIEANKLSTKIIEKSLHNSQILAKLSKTEFNFSNGIQVLEVDTPDELAAVRAIDLQFNVQPDIALINQLYLWAKSLLGINDSSQGKQDTTATSGRAKEAQISRAQARQASKIVMKNYYYQLIYRSIFEFALAYMDEPRNYPYRNEVGDAEDLIFSRYDFLEQDDFGKWYYNDQFIITIDATAGAAENRQYCLELMEKDFSAGLYGDVSDPESVLTFWKDRESLGYPNAKRQVARWEKKVQELQAMQEQQAQMMAAMAGGGLGLTVGEPAGEAYDLPRTIGEPEGGAENEMQL